MQKKISSAFLAVALIISGCSHGMLAKSIDEDDFRNYKEGVTTRKEVKDKYGDPHAVAYVNSLDCDTYGKPSFTGFDKSSINTFCYDSNGILKQKTRAVQ